MSILGSLSFHSRMLHLENPRLVLEPYISIKLVNTVLRSISLDISYLSSLETKKIQECRLRRWTSSRRYCRALAHLTSF